MNDVKTFSLSRHSRLFAVPDSYKDYLFVSSGNSPYHEEPYRAESNAIVYIKEGGVKLNAGLASWEVQAPSIITLGASVIRYFTKSSDFLKMDVIFFKDSFLLERHADLFFLNKYDFFENNDLHVLSLDEHGVDKFKKIYELIQLTQSGPGYNQAEIVRSYIFALIYEVDAYHWQHLSKTSSSVKSHPLFAKFRHLLSKNYKQEHRLEFYADHLHLTPKSLSAAIKKQTGKSAGKWIDDAIILEAKVLLQNKSLSVSQISEILNFSDQSVFGKFFRSATKMSPVEYRQKFD
ncbi:helix-turn-helix transcriptional regulator [Mucilaginibacter rubeus]|uniref:Helix-turn-helix transcriptional regulator n=1 Tax=Mucilaginibacter rubeus TaxID=2027860 RepID=A0AAE6MGI5_9SPHI|nr:MULTISPECIES: AraC family transcriptional regulator [Mucilaginibacter]QEM02600.1 helix-turn-helix transcriptional regulator [Mucilaginibacter rubeus]QEM15221.1 helix-turn-helix transcriptional regulator [Mucilaginibacter gossypii]QTE42055.1 helix-turn-helix transcriptional regulator [Mucilaginibacter rubeus]QTE48656.1 helix-turn-helix transcriptional regulator [Mucilaginibacter rubeus]QTE60042.1 helix-turn-helix transcriptional regulator [Mucilaginibacter rubeus]